MDDEVDCCIWCNMNKPKRSSSSTIHRAVTTEATSGTAANKKKNVKKTKKKQIPGLNEVLQNVLFWFETEKAQGAARLLRSPKRRLAKATKLSYGVIKRRLDELDPVQKVVKSLVKKEERRQYQPNKKFSSAEEEWVGKIVLDLQSKSQCASLNHLKAELKEKGVEVSQTTLRKVLEKQGFRYCWKDKCWECVPILKGVHQKRLGHKKDNANTNAEDEDFDDDEGEEDDEEEEDDDDFLESEDGTFNDKEDGASQDL